MGGPVGLLSQARSRAQRVMAGLRAPYPGAGGLVGTELTEPSVGTSGSSGGAAVMGTSARPDGTERRRLPRTIGAESAPTPAASVAHTFALAQNSSFNGGMSGTVPSAAGGGAIHMPSSLFAYHALQGGGQGGAAVMPSAGQPAAYSGGGVSLGGAGGVGPQGVAAGPGAANPHALHPGVSQAAMAQHAQLAALGGYNGYPAMQAVYGASPGLHVAPSMTSPYGYTLVGMPGAADPRQVYGSFGVGHPMVMAQGRPHGYSVVPAAAHSGVAAHAPQHVTTGGPVAPGGMSELLDGGEVRFRRRAINSARRNRDKTSKFVGVGWNPGTSKWQARITIDSKTAYLGYFNDARSAAAAYDAKCVLIGRPPANGTTAEEQARASALTAKVKRRGATSLDSAEAAARERRLAASRTRETKTSKAAQRSGSARSARAARGNSSSSPASNGSAREQSRLGSLVAAVTAAAESAASGGAAGGEHTSTEDVRSVRGASPGSAADDDAAGEKNAKRARVEN